MDKELIAKLEQRVKELYAQETGDSQLPPNARAALKAARDLLIQDIEDRIAALRAGVPVSHT